jgi:hypothetical protein
VSCKLACGGKPDSRIFNSPGALPHGSRAVGARQRRHSIASCHYILVLIDCILPIIDFAVVFLQLEKNSIIIGGIHEDDLRAGNSVGHRAFNVRIG